MGDRVGKLHAIREVRKHTQEDKAAHLRDACPAKGVQVHAEELGSFLFCDPLVMKLGVCSISPTGVCCTQQSGITRSSPWSTQRNTKETREPENSSEF